MKLTHQQEVLADFHQFYIQDETSRSSLADAWTEEATDRMVAVAEGVIGVGTVRATTVPVQIDVVDGEPELDRAACDLLVDAGIHIPSGVVVVAGATDYLPSARRFSIPAGMYRARVCFRRLSTLSRDGLNGDDTYEIYLWRISAASEALDPPVVLLDQRAR